MSVPAAPPLHSYNNTNTNTNPNDSTALVVAGSNINNNNNNSTSVSNTVDPPLTGIQSIPIKKTLMLINNFVINTSDFLNKFVSISESKLMKVEQQINKLEILLALLDSKLDSIQWLNNGNTTTNITPNTNNTTTNNNDNSIVNTGVPQAPTINNNDNNNNATTPNNNSASDGSSNNVSTSNSDKPVISLKDDSRYHKWFKFLSMKIPKEQLKMRMGIEAPNLDPSMLDLDPNFPAPEGAVHINNATALVHVPSVESDDESDNENNNDDS